MGEWSGIKSFWGSREGRGGSYALIGWVWSARIHLAMGDGTDSTDAVERLIIVGLKSTRCQQQQPKPDNE